MDGRRILLHFGAVDYKATVWVNGRFAGEHEGGHTPFRFEITSLLIAGTNSVTVRVEDPPSDRYLPRGKQHWEEKSESIFYTRTTGIWQTVWIEPVGSSYLEKVKVDATIDGTATFEARIARPEGDLQLAATVRWKGELIATSIAQVFGPQATVAMVIRDPHLWTPETPNLYELEYSNCAAAMRCWIASKSYFGFRTIGVQDGGFCSMEIPST